eukprot:scaffold67459_cov71-Phaeocystis_antarctica.AAC.1
MRSGLPAAAPPRLAPTPRAAGRRDSVRRLGRPRPSVAVRVVEQRTFTQVPAPDQMKADAARCGQAGDGEDLGDRLGRAVIGHARPLRGLVPVVAGRGDQRALAHGDELGEGRDGHSHRRHCCGADAIQHAEGGQPIGKGALDL